MAIDETVIRQRLTLLESYFVHDYVRIDDAIVYGILKRRLTDFETFAGAVKRYLEEIKQP